MSKTRAQRQVPGRIEALRLVLQQGPANSSPELRHLAGFDARFKPKVSPPLAGTMTFSDGTDRLTEAERAALPF